MSSKFVIYIVLTSLLFISCNSDDDTPIDETDVTDSVLIEINKLRTTGCKCGTDDMPAVPALVSNPLLTKTAVSYANDMNARNYFSHISPEGTSPIQRASVVGYTGKYVGEVIARNYSTSAEVVLGWKNSEDHCKAMMSNTYVEMGAGKSRKIWVANLGK
ncbi:CAP domain-containing protein [Flavobacterium sp. MMLR14_040]|uniref:CAP domain-containing protein n=1 Tax=Flavobacterium sp. MMLR14_040 TaxID=3093843 RepID=UPI00299011BC|nr:CAP domain-containing protein [Flavobacterium sp. MMLR14_040]MDW8848612.1 CAP domain-containing protein [Flavobacterium sp. MMLR14_040]